MIRRPIPKYVPKLEPITVVFTQTRPPVNDLMSWYEEQNVRSAWLWKQWAHLLTPKRREAPKFEGYVPEPYNSDGVRIRGVSGDSHRAAHR